MSPRRSLAHLRALAPAERRALLHALVLLPAYALRVRLFGLRRSLPRARAAPAPTLPPASLARLVAAAARHGPWRARCLPVSLALQHLLLAHGIASRLRVGVRTVNGRLEAHAWVERAGAVLLDVDDSGVRFEAFEVAIGEASRSLR